MKTYDLTTLQGKDIIIDISRLLSDEVLYINATKLALQFGKNKQRLNEYLNSKSFLEYKEAVFKVTKNRDFKSVKSTELELVKTVKGKYGGTYLHSKLAIFFLRWLNAEFAVKCDMYITQQIQAIHNDKIIADATAKAKRLNAEWVEAREEAKTTRNELTDAIKEFCKYAVTQRGTAYKKDTCPYYVKLTHLVYKLLGIPKPKGMKPLRDVYSGAIVQKIEYLETMLTKLLRSHIIQETEYHEAFANIKEALAHEAMLLDDEVA